MGSERVTNTRKPSVSFDDDLFNEILERVMTGESVNSICSEPGMPARKSFYMWILNDENLRDKYEFALLSRSFALAEDLIHIADTPVGSLDSGATDTGAVQKQRLQVDTRKWLLSKLVPKKYGDKVTQELTGPNGGPIQHQDVSELTDEQLAAIANGQQS